jgi:ankyrin repeat protein
MEILSKRYIATQLHEAARNGDIACLEEMLGQGQDPDLAGAEGRTPLHYAALFGHVPAVDILLRNSATVSVRDMRGQPRCTWPLTADTPTLCNASYYLPRQNDQR